jgi:hypothetical protein
MNFLNFNVVLNKFISSLNRRSDEEFSESNIKVEAATSTEYFGLPRIAQVASTSSESRRKSTPTRIAPASVYQQSESPASAVRVKGVIRDSPNSKCLYLLVESSQS